MVQATTPTFVLTLPNTVDLTQPSHFAGFIKCKLYRCRRAGFLRGATQQVVRMLNEM